MAKKASGGLIVLFVILGLIVIGFGAYKSMQNRLVTLDENVESAWAQVQNQYQRRYDLIPNLVSTVKGYASHEKEVFENVANARANAGGQLMITSDILNDEAAFARFQQAQDELGSSLRRLLAVSENYPELKADQNFLALQDQLEGTENRIATERMRYIDAVKNYNIEIRKFPVSFFAKNMGFEKKATFTAASDVQSAPKVEF
ncbi:MAG: LemA family protein [Treponema sp.]|nr:LemA family protein [Treponema sp.]